MQKVRMMEEMEVDIDNGGIESRQKIQCWGGTASGELGMTGDPNRNVRLPTMLDALNDKGSVIQIACGKQHSVILMDNGLVYSCGANNCKQLGRDGRESVPEKLTMLETQRIIQVACGDDFTVVLNSDNQLYAFGANDKGQLGSEVRNFIPKPRRIKDSIQSVKIVKVACGARHCIALASNGKVFSWGDNENGQLGLGSKDKYFASPNEMKAVTNLPIYMIAAGREHNFALTVSGTLFGWGKNSSGQLGLGDEKDRNVPTLVKSLRGKSVTYVCCGGEHTAGLTKFGRVFTFGSSRKGQLGHGNLGIETLPKQVIELTGDKVLQIACGSSHTLAFVEGNGKLYSFGTNNFGQLGVGDETKLQKAPTLVKGKWGSNGATNSNRENIHIQTIFAGGNQSFSVLHNDQNHTLRYCQRVMNLNERTTYFLTESKINELVRQCDGSEDEKKHAIDYVTTVFSSPSCLNGSFLDPDTHETTDIKNHGINIASWGGNEKGFMLRKMIANLRKPKPILDAMKPCFSSLLTKLNGIPCDFEALRVFLIIPEILAHDKVEERGTIVASFGEKILDMKDEVRKILCTWWSTLPPSLFLRIVTSFKLCTKTMMNYITSSEKLKNLQISLVVLSFLNKVNDESNFIIPYEAFYIPAIQQKINIPSDFLLLINDPSSFCFCKFPFILNAEAKSEIIQVDAKIQMHQATERQLAENFFHSIRQENELISSPYLVFHIRRGEYLMQDTLRQIDNVRKELGKSEEQILLEFKKPLKIVFENEEGIDMGGPKKEFFLLLIEEIFDQKYGMFKEIESSSSVWFNSQSFEDPEMYYLIGVICGLALYNSVIIDVHFPPVLYKKLLNQKPTFSDFKTFDPDYARTLQYLLDYPNIDDLMDVDEGEAGTIEDVFGFDFQVMEVVYGEKVYTSLIENAADTFINEDNRQQYVDLLVDYYLNKSVKAQYDKFEEGFYSVCNRNIIMNFLRPNELMEMISGCEDYDDFMQLRENAEYRPEFDKEHPLIVEFWKILEEFDLDLKKKFLAFLTGSHKIPIHGIKSLKIIIILTGNGNEELSLPVAHTCFNQLLLPRYKNGVMKERIEYALNNFSRGFGIE